MGLIADARSIAQRDPAARNTLQVMLLYAGFHALVFHRIAHFLFRHRRFFISRLISQIGRFFTGVEIHPGARIGSGLFIDHGMGVVIGETSEIGNNCTIYHNVTLGGTGKEKGKRHPTLGDNVLVGAGAKILGPFKVGSNSLIGANAVVLNEIPENSTVVGVPGRIVRLWGRPVSTVKHSIELDHGNVPDPMEQDLCLLLHRVAALERLVGVPRRSVSGSGRTAVGPASAASPGAAPPDEGVRVGVKARGGSRAGEDCMIAGADAGGAETESQEAQPDAVGGDDDSEACDIAIWPADKP